MNEMIERVARALAGDEADKPGPYIMDDGRRVKAGGFCWQTYVWQARDAIAAMREPTEAMVEAGDRELLKVYRSGSGTNAAEIFRAMIDAALKEG